ncbi:histidine kinase [Endozoicomonas sp. OPT23]|uniref:response regulator n=1 Tax=Endozoicomonas sp. OPT23 TaxID=2072845 RepID=UPI00129BEEC0|nr:response regulator [Endozoicomonas sp. OPT23]MRI31518.1 histidine kinase [Endozoicomonas sp. OPT23]
MPDTEKLNLNILIAEDNKVNQMVARKLLEKLGCSFELAEDGAKALELLESGLLKKEPFDLVLMDIMMPVMDGIEATKQIRASNHSYSKIPVIAYTASVSGKDRETCLAAGIDEFLSKPASAEKLAAMLTKYQS